ncbi:hypothetical protein ACOMHN_016343 [Nucella lapillus]
MLLAADEGQPLQQFPHDGGLVMRLTNWADPLVVSRSTVFCRLASLLSGMVSTTSQRKGKTTSSHCVLHTMQRQTLATLQESVSVAVADR